MLSEKQQRNLEFIYYILHVLTSICSEISCWPCTEMTLFTKDWTGLTVTFRTVRMKTNVYSPGKKSINENQIGPGETNKQTNSQPRTDAPKQRTTG